eukprot:scaffold203651_cov21-Tisochrysis_lutea.AAC.2
MLSLMNYRGLTVVGNSMVASAIAIVVPFVLLVVLSVPHIKPVNWLEYKEEEVDWGALHVLRILHRCFACKALLTRNFVLPLLSRSKNCSASVRLQKIQQSLVVRGRKSCTYAVPATLPVQFQWATMRLLLPPSHYSQLLVQCGSADSRLGGQLAKNTWTAHPSLVLFVRRNLNYWDCVSTLAGEVRNPGKNFPRALLMAVILVVAMYLLPTMAALGVSSSADPAAGWGMGYYCQVAEKVGGLNGKLCSYFSS